MNKDSTEKDLRQELEVLKKSLAEATCALTRVMNERDAAIKERDAARVVWLAMRRERDGANDEIKGFVLDAVSTDEEVAKLRAEAESRDILVARLNDRLAALRATFDKHRRAAELDQFAAGKSDDVREDNVSPGDDALFLGAEVDGTEGWKSAPRIAAACGDVSGFGISVICYLYARLGRATRNYASRGDVIAINVHEINRLREERAEQRGEVVRPCAEVRRLVSVIASVKRDWLAMRQQRDDARTDAANRGAELDEVDDEIARLNDRLATLRATLDKDRRDAAAGAVHEADVDALRAENDKLRDEGEHLGLQVITLEAEVIGIRDDRSALRRERAARALPTIKAEDAVQGVEYLLRHGDWSCDIVILGDAGWRFASRMSPRPDIDDDRILTPLPAVEPDAAEGWADDTEYDLEECP